MNSARRIAPWLSRFVLLAATIIFTLIGVRYLSDPVGAARAVRTSIDTAAGATSMRVGLGAFPLGIAAILAVCLISSHRRRFGLGIAATVMGLALGARLLGIALDGPAPESSRLLAPEIIMLALSVFAAALDWSVNRATAYPEPEPAEPLASGSIDRLRRRAGSALAIGPAVLLGGSAIVKLIGVPAVAAQLASIGFGRLVPLVGVLELASALLLAFALTRPLGMLMVSAFLGGAIAAHLAHAQSPLPPALPLAVIWIGAWLRHREMPEHSPSRIEVAAARAARGPVHTVPL
jgi:hypothetical protein